MKLTTKFRKVGECSATVQYKGGMDPHEFLVFAGEEPEYRALNNPSHIIRREPIGNMGRIYLS